jgi:hypothetical protein
VERLSGPPPTSPGGRPGSKLLFGVFRLFSEFGRSDEQHSNLSGNDLKWGELIKGKGEEQWI